MSRILTGVQSSGRPHLGNILGLIIPAVNLSRKSGNDSFYFIADLHSLTTFKDPKERISNTYAVAAAWLAFGFDNQNNYFYRQSKIPEVCELAWYLSCFTPYPMLTNMHAFKAKENRLSDVNAGLFIYPILMAADIILYDANYVPVGKDQQQHIEIVRDIATMFNSRYGETFVVPEYLMEEEVMTIPGTDGQKMSKSYNNYIDIFAEKKQLKKQIMSIVSDAKTLEEPKDFSTCNIFKLYSLLASKDEVTKMKNNYLAGNYGYGHAKNELYELILTKFRNEIELYNNYITNIDILEKELKIGEEKARIIAQKKIIKLRELLGFL